MLHEAWWSLALPHDIISSSGCISTRFRITLSSSACTLLYTCTARQHLTLHLLYMQSTSCKPLLQQRVPGTPLTLNAVLYCIVWVAMLGMQVQIADPVDPHDLCQLLQLPEPALHLVLVLQALDQRSLACTAVSCSTLSNAVPAILKKLEAR